MFTHQPGQSGAVLGPVLLAQTVGLGPFDTKRVHHILRHPHLDLVEQADAWMIKRVIKVEHPGFDMGKMLFRHGAMLGTCDNMRNAKT